MGYRVVTGQFFRAGTTPWVNGEVWFTLQKGSYSAAAHYPADSLKLLTDADGRVLANLWISDEAQAATNWLCRQPSGETFKFGVPAGVGPIALEDLRALGAPPVVASPSMSALIDSRIAAHNADTGAHPGLGGGGPGGGTAGSSYETTFAQTDLSIVSLLPIAHGLPTSPSAIAIYDDSGGVVEPDFWRSVAANQIEVSLESFAPIIGLWRISVVN
jgi:hypothetical protein